MPRTERPLGPDGGELTRFAADLRLLRTKAGGLPYRELARRLHYSSTTLADAASGRKLPTLTVTLAYVRGCGGDPVEWEARWRALAAELAGLQPENGPVPDGAGECPYVGLRAFQPEDAGRFFGREQLTDDLVARVRAGRFLAAFGASGSGKSSLLRAGLIPRLRAGAVTGTEGWPVVLLTPGPHPLEECAARVAAFAHSDAAGLHPRLRDDSRALHVTVLQALADHPPDRDLVLVVDQFEEVFTLCANRQERAQFIAALLAAVQAANSRTRVALGVRADFYPRCAEHPDLVNAMRDAHLLVAPMSTDELRRAVTQPAVQANCTVETSLLAAIVSDATGQPGALPLVSHALVETWRRRRGNTLTLAGYQAAGGIRAALAQTAEAIYTSLAPDQQRLTRDLFLRLTALGEGTEDTKRRISRDELIDDPRLGAVLDILAGARLVTLGENTVEIAHEALIVAWPRLHQWLTEDREGVRTHRQLTEAAQTWTSLSQDAGALYRGARLAITREWAARQGHRGRLNSTERAFLDASVAAAAAEQRTVARRQRQLRCLTISLAILLLVATTVGVAAVRQREDAVHARQAAISRQLAAQALALVGSRPGTAMLLSLEAIRAAPTAEARSALLSMSAHQAYQAQLAGHTDAVSEVAFSPDGRMLATASKDKTVTLWDARRRTRLRTLSGQATWLRAVRFSPDGHTLATGGDDRDVVLWDPATGARLATLSGHTGLIKDITFSPDGRTLASASSDHTVILWDTASRTRRVVLTGHTDFVQTVAFSPDGRTVATGSADQTIGLWDSATGAQVATLTGHTRSVDQVAFSPDGRTLASASPDQTVTLWDTASRTRRATLTGHTDQVRAVAFSPDGRLLASAGHDHTVMLWDTERLTRLATLTGHSDSVYSLAFDPAAPPLAPLLASASEDGTVILWDPSRLPLTGHADRVDAVAFNNDGHTLASGGGDGTVTVWDAEHRTRVASLNSNGPVNAVAFGHDGHTLAAATGSALQPPTARDYTLTVWDAPYDAPPVRLAGHADRVRDVAYSPDGRTLATASSDQTVMLWDVQRRVHLATLTGDNGPVAAVAFSPDGRTLAAAGHGPDLLLWDMTNHAVSAHLSGYTGQLRTVEFGPDGHTLASAGTDQTVMLWDVEHRTRLATLTGHTGPVNAVAFSPDGHTLASASADRTVILWSTDIGQTRTRICGVLARDLTRDEWAKFMPEAPYHKTCS